MGIILNKSDLPAWVTPADALALTPDVLAPPIAAVSLLTGAGIADLEQLLTQLALGGAASESAGLVARARHRDALRAAAASLAQAQVTLADGFPLELVAEDLRAALNALGAITGEHITEDVLTSIFSEFCIGK
jgi:tRNA modification GTPase